MPLRDPQTGRFLASNVSGSTFAVRSDSPGAGLTGTTIVVKADLAKIDAAAEKTAFRNFGHAAASISRDAKSTIEKGPGPSPPGRPPRTRKGLLKRAIRFSADRESGVVGPLGSLAGDSGAAHELGGRFREENFPQREFMRPALVRALPRFAGDWSGSVGE